MYEKGCRPVWKNYFQDEIMRMLTESLKPAIPVFRNEVEEEERNFRRQQGKAGRYLRGGESAWSGI